MILAATNGAIGDRAGEILWVGIRSIAAEQLPHGEIPNYKHAGDDCWEYCFSPLVSAYVHRALAVFDPFSAYFDLTSLELAGEGEMRHFGMTVANIRRGIYRFLCWQESAKGSWRFFGRGSGLPPDLDTTACAAAVCLDRKTAGVSQSNKVAGALSAFPASCGYFDSPGSRGSEFGSSGPLGRVGNANVLCCMAMAGLDHDALAAAVLRNLGSQSFSGPPGFALAYCLGNAYRLGEVQSLADIAGSMTSEIRRQTHEWRGPLSTALAISAMLDYGQVEEAKGEIREQDLQRLERCITASQTDKLEAFCDERCSSSAMTTAISMSALARALKFFPGGGGGFAA